MLGTERHALHFNNFARLHLLTRYSPVYLANIRDETSNPKNTRLVPTPATEYCADLSTESMFVAEEKWQTTRATIRERTKFTHNNDLFSDVKFVVRTNDDETETESKRVIPAHKFVLSIGSPVFEAMFYGELAETRDSIELPDCEYESLLELFRFMYCDEVKLSGSNVMGVLYLAKKYMVPSLAEKCTKYLQDNLEPSNVFSILPSAQRYEEKNLVDR